MQKNKKIKINVNIKKSLYDFVLLFIIIDINIIRTSFFKFRIKNGLNCLNDLSKVYRECLFIVKNCKTNSIKCKFAFCFDSLNKT